jgi:lipoprotein-releasing system permease protein
VCVTCRLLPLLPLLTFERFVVRRYLRGPRQAGGGRRFLRFVLVVAVGGVAVGVATLLLALAIVRGFSREIEGKIVGFGAHVQVESLRDAPLSADAVTAAQLRAEPGVRGVAPSVIAFVLARRSATRIEGVSLWGVEALPSYVAGQVQPRAFSFAPDAQGRKGLVVGKALARQLGLRVGDPLTLLTPPEPGTTPGFGLAGTRIRQYRVAGLYETSLANFDEVFVFGGLAEARDFLGLPGDAVTRYDLTLATPDSATAVARRIEATYGPPVMARSIFEAYANLFAWVRLQQSIVPLVLTIIVAVAAFNLIGILLMLMLEKTGDLAILRSMGASARQVRRLFVALGAAVGGVGALLGSLLAVGVALLQQRTGVLRLPAEAYFLDRAPVLLLASDVGLVAGVAVVLCLVAAYLPARVAARLDPVRVLRFR